MLHAQCVQTPPLPPASAPFQPDTVDNGPGGSNPLERSRKSLRNGVLQPDPPHLGRQPCTHVCHAGATRPPFPSPLAPPVGYQRADDFVQEEPERQVALSRRPKCGWRAVASSYLFLEDSWRFLYKGSPHPETELHTFSLLFLFSVALCLLRACLPASSFSREIN